MHVRLSILAFLRILPLYAQVAHWEVLINSETSNIQTTSTVVGLLSDAFVITWQSLGQDSQGWGIFAQIFDSSGIPKGTQFIVNSYQTYNQEYPSLASFNDGSFLVVWQTWLEDASGWGIAAKIFDSFGNPLIPEFLANTITLGDQQNPGVASFQGNSYLIVWQTSVPNEGTNFDIYARIYSPQSIPSSAEFLVNNHTYMNQTNAVVATFSDLSCLIVWQSENQDPDSFGWGIFARFFDHNGNSLSAIEFLINGNTTNNQEHPDICALSDDRFIVAWQSDHVSAGSCGIYYKIYQPHAVSNTSDLLVYVAPGGSMQLPKLSCYGNSNWVITWQESQIGSSPLQIVWGQIIYTNGNLGPLLQLAQDTAHNSSQPAVSYLTNGDQIFVWTNDGQDTDQGGIYGKRFDSFGQEICFEVIKNCEQCLLTPPNFCNGNNSCNFQKGTCVQCTSSLYCQNYHFPLNYCDPESLDCVICQSGSGCQERYSCHPILKDCVQCISNINCSVNFTGTDWCNTEVNACVQCLETSQCSFLKHCNPSNFSCVVDGPVYTMPIMTIVLIVLSAAYIGLHRTTSQFYALIRVIQQIHYLIFLNVVQPPVFTLFLQQFGLGGYDFVLSIFSLVTDNVETGAHFNYNRYNGILLQNCGSIFTFGIVLLLIFLIIGGLKRQNQKRIRILQDFESFFAYNGLAKFWLSICPELLIGSLLQISTLNFNTIFIGFSAILSFFFLLSFVIFGLHCVKITKKGDISDHRFQFMLSEYKERTVITKYQTLILFIKRSAISISVVTLYYFPPQQIGLNLMIQIFYVLILLYDRPRKSIIQNQLEIAEEIGFMIIYILFGFLWGNNADILQEGFSYTIMGIICIMLIPHLIILLMGLYVGFVKRKVLGNPWSFWDVRFIKRNKPNRKKSPLMIFTSLPKRIHEI